MYCGMDRWVCHKLQYPMPFSWLCTFYDLFFPEKLTAEVQVVLTAGFAHKTQCQVFGKILHWSAAAAEAETVAAAKTETVTAAEAEKQA